MARKKSSKNSKAAGNQAVAATDTPATTATTLDTAQDLLKPAPAEVSQIDPPEFPRTSQQEQQEQEQELEADILPVERAPPRRYEDDNDDEDHHHRSERARLIRTYSNESGTYSDGGRSNLREAGVPESNQPTTWWEWAMRNGLHPRTWNRQTYIKAGLLVTLLTLIILSFTVFRIQDHIKDILKYVNILPLEQECPL